MPVEARRHEFVDLGGDVRKREEGGAKQRELQLRDEIFQQLGVDEFRMVGTCHQDEWPDQHVVDLLGEEKAADKSNAEAHQRLDQAGAQFDQMIEQRRLAGLDLVVAHDALASFSTSGASSVVA